MLFIDNKICINSDEYYVNIFFTLLFISMIILTSCIIILDLCYRNYLKPLKIVIV